MPWIQARMCSSSFPIKILNTLNIQVLNWERIKIEIFSDVAKPLKFIEFLWKSRWWILLHLKFMIRREVLLYFCDCLIVSLIFCVYNTFVREFLNENLTNSFGLNLFVIVFFPRFKVNDIVLQNKNNAIKLMIFGITKIWYYAPNKSICHSK